MSRNVFFLVSRLVQHSLKCFSKRVQKYNFFFQLARKFWSFFKKYFISFSSLFLINLSRNFARFAGCKCNIRFLFSQAFQNLFLENKFSTLIPNYLPVCEWTYALLRVQNYTLYSLLQAFQTLFFDLFLTLSLTIWYHVFWRKKFFEKNYNRTTGKLVLLSKSPIPLGTVSF